MIDTQNLPHFVAWVKNTHPHYYFALANAYRGANKVNVCVVCERKSKELVDGDFCVECWERDAP